MTLVHRPSILKCHVLVNSEVETQREGNRSDETNSTKPRSLRMFHTSKLSRQASYAAGLVSLWLSGRVSVAVTPLPGADRISNDPPKACIRSRILHRPNLYDCPPVEADEAADTAATSKPAPSSRTWIRN